MELDRASRSTRGKRLKQAVEDEEQQADDQFWAQGFFAEEHVDDDYATEEEEEDVADSDFDDEEEADDDEEQQDEDDRPRKKSLKPPGAPAVKSKPKPKPKPPADGDGAAAGGATEGDVAAAPAEAAAAAHAFAMEYSYAVPTLRRSTMARTAEAERERQRVEKAQATKRRPTSAASTWKPLTQQELLAEAARTEVENIQSLRVLLAQEEETKRKAMVVKKSYTGPLIKQRSAKVGDEEQTTLEVCNAHYAPDWLQPQYAPEPPEPRACRVTGLPARYVDARSGAPFASGMALRRLRAGLGPLPHSAALHTHEAYAAQQAADARDGRTKCSTQWLGRLQQQQQQAGAAGAGAAQGGALLKDLGVSASSILSEEDGLPGPHVPKGRRARRSRPSRVAARIGAQLSAPWPAAQQLQQGGAAAVAGTPGPGVSDDVMALVLDLHRVLAA